MKTGSRTLPVERHRRAAAEPDGRRVSPGSVQVGGRRSATDAMHQSPGMVAQRRRLQTMFGPAAQLLSDSDGEEVLQGKVEPIQRWGEMRSLGQLGWKYSGGTMATTQVDLLWHASVYRVDKDGKSAEDGLFYQGFHLTMDAPNSQPHVFFDEKGAYVEKRTLEHNGTKGYMELVGKAVWEQDLVIAKEHAATVFVSRLAKVLAKEDRVTIEEKRSKAEREEDIADEIAGQKRDAAEKAEAEKLAGAQDEETHIKTFLIDVRFFGLKYFKDFCDYLKGVPVKIDSKLELKAVWYKKGRDRGWPIEEKQAVYTGFDKKPREIKWVSYENCTERRRRQPDEGIPKEFRQLKFKGYASYKLHPKALKPPAG